MAKCSSCDYPWAPNSGKCPNCGHIPCFITTAVCRELGLPDDCRELTLLRAFRDRHMTKTPERVDMLKQYYDQAPEIAARIEALPERSSIYSLLRRDFIAPAVDAAERGDDELAERTYINGMQWVVNRVAVDRGKS